MTENEEFEFRARAEKEKSSSAPGFGAKAGAYARGLVSGVVGAPGDIESMVTPKLPKTSPLSGHETALPTSEEVSQGLSKLGWKEPPKSISGYQTAGEYTPAVLSAGKAAYGLGKFGVTKASELANLLTGKTTQTQAEKLGAEATKAGESGGKALTEAEKAQQAELAKSAERQTMATRTGEKAEAAGGRALKGLPGVSTVKEGDAFKPVPQTATDVGRYIRGQAKNFVDSIKKQRSAAADQNFKSALQEARAKQGKQVYVDTKLQSAPDAFVDTSPMLNQIDSMISRGGSSDYLRSIENLKSDLAKTKDFEGLEVIRRRLGDAAFGLPEEGYKAIGQGFAKDMYSKLSKQMKDYSPSFAKYLDDYKRLSQNLEVYGTKVGKGITQTQDAAGNYFAKSADQVAKDAFKSPENYEQLVEALGGNKQVAEAAARRYFASQLETAKTPEAVEALLRDNRAVLRNIPNVRSQIETQYLAPLRSAGTRSTAAKGIVEEAKQYDKTLSSKLKDVEGAKNLVSDAVSALQSVKPGKAIETFENTILPKIRDAESKAGVSVLTEQQINNLRQQVSQLERIADQQQRAKIISGVAAGLVGAQTGYGYLKKLVGF